MQVMASTEGTYSVHGGVEVEKNWTYFLGSNTVYGVIVLEEGVLGVMFGLLVLNNITE